MKRLTFSFCLAALLLAGATVAHAQADYEWMQDKQTYHTSARLAAEYAAAMAASENIETGTGVPLLAMRTRWLWLDKMGSIQTLNKSTFRWRDGNCLNEFCLVVDCFVGVWPQLVCSDGVERVISAPDPATVVLDDRIFKRDLP